MRELVNIDLYTAMCSYLGTSPRKFSCLYNESEGCDKVFPSDFSYDCIESVIENPPEDKRDLRALALAFCAAEYDCPHFYGHLLDCIGDNLDVFLEGAAYKYVPEGDCKQLLEELLIFSNRASIAERAFSLYFLTNLKDPLGWQQALALASEEVVKAECSLEEKIEAVSIIVNCAMSRQDKLDMNTAAFVSAYKSLPNRTKSEVSRLMGFGFSWLDILRMSYSLQFLVPQKGISSSYNRFNTLKSMLLKELQWMPVEWSPEDKQLALRLYKDCRITYKIENFNNLKFWLENTDFKPECMPSPSITAEPRFALLKEADRMLCYDKFVLDENTTPEQIRDILTEWYINTFREFQDSRRLVFSKAFSTGGIPVEITGGIAKHLAYYFSGINSAEAYAFYQMILENEGKFSELINIMFTPKMTYKRAFLSDEESYSLMDVSIANSLRWNNLERARFVRHYLEFPEEPEDVDEFEDEDDSDYDSDYDDTYELEDGSDEYE